MPSGGSVNQKKQTQSPKGSPALERAATLKGAAPAMSTGVDAPERTATPSGAAAPMGADASEGVDEPRGAELETVPLGLGAPKRKKAAAQRRETNAMDSCRVMARKQASAGALLSDLPYDTTGLAALHAENESGGSESDSEVRDHQAAWHEMRAIIMLSAAVAAVMSKRACSAALVAGGIRDCGRGACASGGVCITESARWCQGQEL